MDRKRSPRHYMVMDHGNDPSKAGPSTSSLGLEVPASEDELMRARIAGRLFGTESEVLRFGEYELIRKIGAGGMGVVHAAREPQLDRIVALKRVRSDRVPELERERLHAEARSLAQLSHPNVVQVFAADEFEGEFYMAMEYVEGDDLARWQRATHPSKAALLGVYLQALAGLAAAHEAGIIHRDFKPTNVLIGKDGRVRVADFGLATPQAPSAGTTTPLDPDMTPNSATRLRGTPGYVAPELYRGIAPSPRSDQFSFCVALWEALTLTRPFEPERFMDPDTREAPLPRGKVRPIWLRKALLRGLDWDPEARWASLPKLAAHIEGRMRRRRSLAWATFGLTFTGASVLAYGAYSAPPTCLGQEEILAIWMPEMRAELLATGVTKSERASARVLVDELDSHVAAWAETNAALCSAHRDKGLLSSEGLDLGAACLIQARDRFGALVAKLSSSRRDHERDAALLDRLLLPSDCSNPRYLRSLDASRSIEHSAPREIEHLLAAGEYEAVVESVAGELRAAGPDSSLARIAQLELWDGSAKRRLTRYEDARASLTNAHIHATQIRDHATATRASLELVELLAFDLQHLPSAEIFSSLAEASLTELGRPATLAIELALALAQLAEIQGELADAEAQIRAALERLVHAEGSPRLRETLELRLANLLGVRGESSAALEIYERVLDQRRQRYGDDHPQLGTTNYNIALTLQEQGRVSEARPYAERALRLESRLLDEGSVRLAEFQALLADIELESGELERAIELSATASHTQLSQLPKGHRDRATGLFTHAWALLQAERYAESLDAHRELLDELGQHWESQRMGLHVNIAWLSCRVGRCLEAAPYLREPLVGTDATLRRWARLCTVELALARDLPREASNQIEVLAAELEDLPELDDPELVAQVAFLRLRALVELDQFEAARARVEAARSTRDQLPADQRDALTDLLLTLQPSQ